MGVQVGLEVGHQERRRHALSADIGNGDGHPAIRQANGIVVVAPHVVVRAIPRRECPVVVVGQYTREQHGLHVARQFQLPLQSGRPDALERHGPVAQGHHQDVGEGGDEAHMPDGRAHAPALLLIAHHHVGNDIAVLFHRNGEVEFHLGVARHDGMVLSAQRDAGIIKPRQPRRVSPFDRTIPSPILLVPTKQGEFAHPDGLEDAAVMPKQRVIGDVLVDGLREVQKGIRLLAEPLEPLPVPEFGRHAVYFLTRSEYSPVRVSTLTRSPMLMNNGTRTSAPVSMVAGLSVLVAVSPLTPGSV